MSVTDKQTALAALHHILDAQQVVADPVSLMTYNRDAGLDHGTPDAVVFPHSTADVVRIVQWARKHQMPLIGRGAGTGLSGGAVAEHGGVIVEFSRMQHILAFDEQSGSATAQTGVITMLLDNLVAAKGWYYPPDPSSGRASTLGGNIGENSGGPHCFKYGVTANYVTGLEVVLADGQHLHLGGHALDYPALDLVSLMTGSEGTLGLMTEAHLRLIRMPPAVKTMIAAFESVEAAGAAVSDIIARGLTPATMEMMDQDFLRIIEDFTHAGFPTEAGAALIIEVDGYPQSVGPQMDEIVETLRAHKIHSVQVAQTEEERAGIWYGRKSAAGAIARLAPAFYLVDVTVPRSKLAVTLAEVNRICKNLALRVIYVFHAGDGNLHPLILIEDLKDQEHIGVVLEAGHQIVEVCIQHDGSITGEHGVGIEKRAHMPRMYSAEELHAMQAIRDVFDPKHLLNPAKIFPPDVPEPAPLPEAGSPPASPFAPETAREAAEAIRAWATAGQQVRIVGGGTKSRSLPPTDAHLSTRKLHGISTYARDDLYVTVGAGTRLNDLQAELAPDSMWVPLVSPWAESTIGGMVAAAFNAPLRMRYGGLRDLVLSATVALPSGHTIRAGRPVVKNVAGYDLPKLLVGSHGTLGLLTDITLKLAPMPRARTSLVVPVAADTELAALERALELGVLLRRVCLVTSSLLLCRGQAVAAALPQAASLPYVLLYTAEGLPEDVAAELEEVRRVVQTAHTDEPFEIDGLAGSDVWATLVRGEVPPTSSTLVRLGVPPAALHMVLVKIFPTLADMPFMVDVPGGLMYAQITGDIPSYLEHVRLEAHAVGGYACAPLEAGNAAYDAWGFQPVGLELMRGIKARWDEQGVLNPGAFLF